jgi:peroxiredoxin
MRKLVLLLFGLILIGLSIRAQIPDKAEDISPLLIGEMIPDVVLKAPDASDHSLSDILSEKPTVILVYRGGWCPYCNVHLADMQGAESEIIELGYQIVAISPDSPENLQLTGEKNKLNYRLFSDGDGTFMKALGIAFKAPDRNIEKLKKNSAGLNEGYLPVPSVFVVDTSGIIEFEYINPTYKTRLGADFLLAVLKVLTDTEQ